MGQENHATAATTPAEPPIDAAATARLTEFLSGAVGHAVLVTGVLRLTGGAIQENWLVDVTIEGGPLAGGRKFVLRTPSHRGGVAESHPPAHEFALLKAAWDAGVTVPEPLWVCDDEMIIGKPFFIMRHIAGVSLGQKIVREPALEPLRNALAMRLGEELARIHTIRPGHTGLNVLPMPKPDPAAAAISAYRAYLDSHTAPHPVLEWGLRWAELNAPPVGEIVLCHRDFRTGNYMVNRQSPENGGLTGMLDWEFAGWGSPMEDVAWFCAKCWRFGANAREAGGISTRDRFYDGYVKASGRDIDPGVVKFWEVMAHVRWAVIAIQQTDRYFAGAEPSLELAAIGRRPAEMEVEILKLTCVL